MENKILRSYFPNYLSSDALFTKMSLLGAPWPQEVGQDMDDAYFTMYSGIKSPSEFVTLHLNPDTEIANSLTIARILYGMYGQQWTRLWDAYKLKYNPIDNYNIEETVSSTKSNDRTTNRINNLTSTVDGTENQTTKQDTTQTVDGTTSNTITTDTNGTNSLQHGEQIQTDGENDEYTYGFNSEEKVPTSVVIENSTETHSGTDTTTTTEHSTSSNDGTSKTDTVASATGSNGVITSNNRTDKVVEDTMDTLEGKEDITRTRTGNVGQNSYQELIKQEFDLWRWNFFTQVFEDVDKYLTLSVCAEYPCWAQHFINRFSQLN